MALASTVHYGVIIAFGSALLAEMDVTSEMEANATHQQQSVFAALVSTTVHYGVLLTLGSALLAEMDVSNLTVELHEIQSNSELHTPRGVAG